MFSLVNLQIEVYDLSDLREDESPGPAG